MMHKLKSVDDKLDRLFFALGVANGGGGGGGGGNIVSENYGIPQVGLICVATGDEGGGSGDSVGEQDSVSVGEQDVFGGGACGDTLSNGSGVHEGGGKNGRAIGLAISVDVGQGTFSMYTYVTCANATAHAHAQIITKHKFWTICVDKRESLSAATSFSVAPHFYVAYLSCEYAG